MDNDVFWIVIYATAFTLGILSSIYNYWRDAQEHVRLWVPWYVDDRPTPGAENPERWLPWYFALSLVFHGVQLWEACARYALWRGGDATTVHVLSFVLLVNLWLVPLFLGLYLWKLDSRLNAQRYKFALVYAGLSLLLAVGSATASIALNDEGTCLSHESVFQADVNGSAASETWIVGANSPAGSAYDIFGYPPLCHAPSSLSGAAADDGGLNATYAASAASAASAACAANATNAPEAPPLTWGVTADGVYGLNRWHWPGLGVPALLPSAYSWLSLVFILPLTCSRYSLWKRGRIFGLQLATLAICIGLVGDVAPEAFSAWLLLWSLVLNYVWCFSGGAWVKHWWAYESGDACRDCRSTCCWWTAYCTCCACCARCAPPEHEVTFTDV